MPVAPLSTIPNVYFEDSFQLENPRVFDIVSERSEVTRRPEDLSQTDDQNPPIRKTLATNAILQEKLSWYMDTVEMHLISSISTASSSFFTALGDLRQLHAEAAASVDNIKTLRADLADLDQSMVQGAMNIVALQRQRGNMRKLGNAIHQLNEVVSKVTDCESQIDRGEVETAMDGLDAVEMLMAGTKQTQKLESSSTVSEGRPLIDLRGIKALRGAPDDIASLRTKIGKIFEQRFLDALLGDLRRHVDSVPTNATLERWEIASQRAKGVHVRKPSAFPAYLQMDEGLRESLQTNLNGLARSDCLKRATTAYKDALWREVKSLIRRHLPSSNDDDMESTMSASTLGGRKLSQQEKSSILARNLRALEAEDAELMLRKIYSNVGEALRRLGLQVKIVLDVTSTFNSSRSTVTSPKSPPVQHMAGYIRAGTINSTLQLATQQDDVQQILDMSNLLGHAVDIAQAQATKILKVRSDQNTQLPLPLFLRYFNLNRLFADECEAVSGRGGAAFKAVVTSHIKDFVRRTGDIERQRLVEGIDRDRWDAKDFSDQENTILTELLTASTRDVENWPTGSVTTDGHGKVLSNGTNSAPIDQTGKEKIRSASIDEQKYILPETALTVLRSLRYFEMVIAGVPSMTQDVTLSLLEYLKLFNSRSSQLILGAGATRSAGLKNITTKHLALASQALSFVTAIIPYMREFVRRYQTNPQGLMIEFDKVRRLYQEHQNGINEKLVDIMTSRAATHVIAMRKIAWDTPSSVDGTSPYMETLVKETTTLYKVLSKHLPDSTVQAIMIPVFQSYRSQWREAFEQVTINTPAGCDRILRDLEFFKSRIGKIEGGDGIGEDAIAAVKQKVPDQASKGDSSQPDQPDRTESISSATNTTNGVNTESQKTADGGG